MDARLLARINKALFHVLAHLEHRAMHMQELVYPSNSNAILTVNVEKMKNVVVVIAYVCLLSSQIIEMETDVKVLVINLDVV